MPAKPNRHDWNALDTYFHIHEAYLRGFMDDGFVIDHDLGDPLVLSNTVLLRGRIRCQHGIYLDVVKVLEIERRNGKAYVRTQRYNYQAMIAGNPPRPIFRYDNAHGYPGHADYHHKHCVDYRAWEYIEPPEWIGHDRWPHISDVVEELQLWWLEIGQYLDPV